MSVLILNRVRTIVSGVGGSPYYLTGYFNPTAGTPQQQVNAWHGFCIPGTVAADVPVGSSWVTSGEVQRINAATGDVIDVETVNDVTINGTYVVNLLPRASQALCRWRTGIFYGGREVKGHTNIPLQTVNTLSPQGGLTSGAVGGILARAAALVADPVTEFCVWSRKQGVGEVVTGTGVWNQYSQLRSRRD